MSKFYATPKVHAMPYIMFTDLPGDILGLISESNKVLCGAKGSTFISVKDLQEINCSSFNEKRRLEIESGLQDLHEDLMIKIC